MTKLMTKNERKYQADQLFFLWDSLHARLNKAWPLQGMESQEKETQKD